MRNSFIEPVLNPENGNLGCLSQTLTKIFSKPNLTLKGRNCSELSEKSPIKDSTFDDLKSQTQLQQTKRNNTMSTSATSRWSKVRTIYQCVRKLRNPSYKQLNRLESFHEDMTNFIRNKKQHLLIHGSATARHKFRNESIEVPSDLSRSRENCNSNNQIYNAAKQLKHLMKISREHEKTRQLFEFAADGSESAIEKMIQLIKQDVS